jgi:hypothetical protein
VKNKVDAWFDVARALVDAILDAEAETSALGLRWSVDDDDDNGQQVHDALWQAQTTFVRGDLVAAEAAVGGLIALAERVPPEEEGFQSPVPHLDALRGLLLLAPRSR